MYVPVAFAARETDALHALIEAHAFATLVSVGPDGPIATHLPFLLDRERGPNGTLVAHLARANPHAALLDGDALAIFLGPHGYVSPAWYGAHPAVPTWNYAAVHAYGRARRIGDAADLYAIVRRLVDTYEGGRARPWSMDGLPPDYTAGMLEGIVGLEIPIARLEGKHKLSQNRGVEDRRNVIAALGASASAEDRALADYMARHAPPPTAA